MRASVIQREPMPLKNAALQVLANANGDTKRRASDEIRAWPTWKLQFVSDVFSVSVGRIQRGQGDAKKKKTSAAR